MRRKKNPFGQIIAKITPIKSGDKTVYFGLYGAVTPNINPISIQEQERKQAQITALLFKAADNRASKLGIAPEEARSHFFPRVVNSVEIAPVSFLDDLHPDDRAEFLLLQQESRELEVKSATLFMQHRLAYDLVLTEAAKVKSLQVYVQEPWFDISVGDKFKFDNQTVTVSAPYDPETGAIAVQPLSNLLQEGDTGFLLAKDGIGYQLGDTQWSEADTQEFLTTRVNNGDEPGQIQLIYSLYQKETGRVSDEDVETEEPVGFQSNGSELSSTSTQILLTGETSTGNSNTSDVPTSGLVAPILETLPIG